MQRLQEKTVDRRVERGNLWIRLTTAPNEHPLDLYVQQLGGDTVSEILEAKVWGNNHCALAPFAMGSVDLIR